jgi:hypothetical protein
MQFSGEVLPQTLFHVDGSSNGCIGFIREWDNYVGATGVSYRVCQRDAEIGRSFMFTGT